MAAKKNKYVPKSYESCRSGDPFAAIYDSMLCAAAFIDLSDKAKSLYLICKVQRNAGSSKNIGIAEQFYMNQALWRDKYGLFNKGNERGFYKAIEELISHGFIRIVRSGKASRERSIYEYSDLWQEYGKPEFIVPAMNYTPSINLKRKRSGEAKGSGEYLEVG
jgi:hypothetical protein